MISLELFRCRACNKIITVDNIKAGIICCNGEVIRCRKLSILEELKLLLMYLTGRIRRKTL